MDAIDLIFLTGVVAAAAAVAAGMIVCLVVWIAGGQEMRASEVCPPRGKP
jgi:hypothetical protein